MQAKNVLTKTTKWQLLSLMTAACFLLIASLAGAQDFKNNELRTFAEAQTEVVKIRSEYFEALDGVQDESKAEQVQEKYVGQMVEAVEETGMTVRKYNEIAQAIQENPDLQQKIDQFTE
ncbi:MAG: DUF4168 domain-containing protein [Desulfohalobiaceae bacterium]|nr:DUF4168 domain-containing protein [Desulfohalobiaceae bacterium]